MTESLEQLVHVGRVEGFEEGAREATERIVRKLTAAGFLLDQIMDLTAASAAEVQRIIGHIPDSDRVQFS